VPIAETSGLARHPSLVSREGYLKVSIGAPP
jgi:hypothetical protein